LHPESILNTGRCSTRQEIRQLGRLITVQVFSLWNLGVCSQVTPDRSQKTNNQHTYLLRERRASPHYFSFNLKADDSGFTPELMLSLIRHNTETFSHAERQTSPLTQKETRAEMYPLHQSKERSV